MNKKFAWLSVTLPLALCALPAAAQTNQPSAAGLASITNKWQSSVSLGLTITRGNSDTLLASATGVTERKWLQNDLSLGADALYGESKIEGTTGTQETAERAHAFIQYNRMLTSRFYAYARLDGLHDGIADIDYRVTLAPGIGYYFIKATNMDLSVEGGPGFIEEKLDGSPSDGYATLRLGEKYHYTINPHAKLWETAEILPQANDLNNYIVNAELGVEASLSKKTSWPCAPFWMTIIITCRPRAV